MKRFSSKNKPLAGLDEAGRGSLYGALFAGACILPSRIPKRIILRDSKKMTAQQREESFTWLQKNALCGVGEASAEEIDTLGLIKAVELAMQRAVNALEIKPVFLIVDGRDAFSFDLPFQSIVRGDSLYKEIAAASILAKVARDSAMIQAALVDTGYELEHHKGYGTAKHRALIKEKGLSPRHRRSFVCK